MSEIDVATTASVTSFVPVDRGLERRGALLLHVPEDVLQDDDRVVDHDADGEREAEQRHAVQREAGGRG